MLTMLGVGHGARENGGPADAHDAGRGCGVWQKEAQLMLMMLGVCAVSVKKKKEAELMLMMLGVGAACGKKGPQLMLMMLGVGAASGKRRPS